MNKCIEIADIPIGITTVYDSLPGSSLKFETDKEPVFSVVTTEEDIENERRKVIEEAIYEKAESYPDYPEKDLESTAVYRKIANILPRFDAIVFHGSAVAVGDKAYLFTAKSGTGKTTHSKLWLKNIKGSYIVNGDKPVIRMIDGKPFVCGTPWMGKENYGTNKNVLLDAICFLKRGEENHLKPLEFSDMLSVILGQSYRPPTPDALLKTLKTIEKIGNSTRLYELTCNMEDEAAITAYRGICNDEF